MTDSTTPMATPSGSPPSPPPTLEEALQSLQALAMGGQTLMEVRSDYATVRDALLALDADAKRYRWIRRQKRGFILRANGTPWSRENGERYICAFDLAVNETGFNGREHIDDLMDEAMAMYPSSES